MGASKRGGMAPPPDWRPAGTPRPRTLNAAAGLLANGSMLLSDLPGAHHTSGARRQRTLRSQLRGQPRHGRFLRRTGFPLSSQNLAALRDRSYSMFLRSRPADQVAAVGVGGELAVPATTGRSPRAQSWPRRAAERQVSGDESGAVFGWTRPLPVGRPARPVVASAST